VAQHIAESGHGRAADFLDGDHGLGSVLHGQAGLSEGVEWGEPAIVHQSLCRLRGRKRPPAECGRPATPPGNTIKQ
jgi:hypothetical protein